MTKLTNKQARFVDEYRIDLNGRQAAIRAGYSEKTAQEQSSRLLSNVKVQAAVQAHIEDQAKRTGIEADSILDALAVIAHDIEGEQTRDRLRALELLGKYQALFTEKHIIEIKEPLRTGQEVITELRKLDDEMAEVIH